MGGRSKRINFQPGFHLPPWIWMNCTVTAKGQFPQTQLSYRQVQPQKIVEGDERRSSASLRHQGPIFLSFFFQNGSQSIFGNPFFFFFNCRDNLPILMRISAPVGEMAEKRSEEKKKTLQSSNASAILTPARALPPNRNPKEREQLHVRVWMHLLLVPFFFHSTPVLSKLFDKYHKKKKKKF